MIGCYLLCNQKGKYEKLIEARYYAIAKLIVVKPNLPHPQDKYQFSEVMVG